MLKVRIWGESQEIEAMIERVCNDTPGMRVLSVSGHYKDRGASVYERVYLDVELHEVHESEKPTTKTCKALKLKASKK